MREPRRHLLRPDECELRAITLRFVDSSLHFDLAQPDRVPLAGARDIHKCDRLQLRRVQSPRPFEIREAQGDVKYFALARWEYSHVEALTALGLQRDDHGDFLLGGDVKSEAFGI